MRAVQSGPPCGSCKEDAPIPILKKKVDPMKTRTAVAALMAVVFLFAGLAGPARSAIPPGEASDGLNLVEDRIDDLLSELGTESGFDPEGFKVSSGLSALLAELKDPEGAYRETPLGEMAARVGSLFAEPRSPESPQDPEDALNRLIVMLLQERLEGGTLDPETEQTVQALLALIPGSLEAYEAAGGGPGFGHGQGGGPDDRDRRIREVRFLENEEPAAAPPASTPPTETPPQGFQPPPGHLNYTPDPPGDPVDPADWDDGSGGNDPRNGFNDPPPAAGFSFPFYGKSYDTFLVGTHGNIVLSDGVTEGDTSWWPADPANPSADPERNLQSVPRVAPLWTDVSPAFRGEVKIDATDTYYRASWDGVGYNPPFDTASFSATLYENGWIAFSYGDVGPVGNHPNSNLFYGETGYHALVGLSPGDGSAADHPGPGQAREWTLVDLSETGGSYDYVNYEGIYEWWQTLDASDGNPFDLANSYLIFTPGSPKYAPTAGTRDMFVDIATVDQALESTLADGGLLAAVDGGDFKPGAFAIEGYTDGFAGSWSGYRHGLQTVGQDAQGNPRVYTNAATLEGINQSGFMAYAVQVEEDRLNREILEMHRERLKGDLRHQVDQTLEYGDIRARDDWLTQKADAQAGRVLKDRNGRWVRVQQYILRPDDQTVQVMNVSLREGDGELAGVSSMDWQTRFTESVEGVNLKTLPWSRWLDTQENETGRYVRTTAGAPELGDMSVAFTNPAEESLKEARWFEGKTTMDAAPVQAISQERLTLVSSGLNGSFAYASGDAPLMDGRYRVVADEAGKAGNPRGFHYALRTGGSDRSVNVAFFVVGDGDRADNQGPASGDDSGVAFKDIWDALRVNEPGAPQIGENNLEIAMDAEKQVFSRPVDVVYIPMSRMLWK